MSSIKTSRGIQSGKFAERRRKVIFARSMFVTVFALLVIGASVFFIRSSLFQIQNIKVEGITAVTIAEVQAQALSALETSATRNIFFVEKEEIQKNLLDHFKTVDSVDISRSGLQTITLNLHERTPNAVVCMGFRDEEATSDCYVSDKHGYIFMPLASSSALTSNSLTSFTHYYVPTDTADSPIGTTFVTEKRLGELEKFVSGARQAGLAPLGVLVGDKGQYEMYVKNKKGDSEATIYFDDSSPFDATLSNLLTFWQNPADTKKATTTKAFDYVNLRFGNTVYYSTQ